MTRPDRATASQADLLNRLMRSHVWSEKERAEVLAELAEGMEKDRASRLIDRAFKVLPERKAREEEGGFCGFCEDEYAVRDVVVEEDESVVGATHRATVATRRKVPACPECGSKHGEAP